jgi:hypothetical protein
VLAGEPPQLSEVGPFTMRRTTANYNICFDHARRRADWQWLHYDELVPDKSCAACTSDALVRFSARSTPRAAAVLTRGRCADLRAQLHLRRHHAVCRLVRGAAAAAVCAGAFTRSAQRAAASLTRLARGLSPR